MGSGSAASVGLWRTAWFPSLTSVLLTHKGTEDILTGGEKLRLIGLSGGRSEEVKSGRSSQEQQAAPHMVWAAGSRLDGPASAAHVLE